MEKAAKPRNIERELREAKAEIAEDREIKGRLMKERDDLQRINERLHAQMIGTVQGLMIERADLLARVHRIDMRIKGLGFEVKKVAELLESNVEIRR